MVLRLVFKQALIGCKVYGDRVDGTGTWCGSVACVRIGNALGAEGELSELNVVERFGAEVSSASAGCESLLKAKRAVRCGGR